MDDILTTKNGAMGGLLKINLRRLIEMANDKMGPHNRSDRLVTLGICDKSFSIHFRILNKCYIDDHLWFQSDLKTAIVAMATCFLKHFPSDNTAQFKRCNNCRQGIQNE